VILSIAGYLISPLLIQLMGGTGDLYNFSTTYLKLAFLDLPLTFLFFNFTSIMNAQGNTLKPTIIGGLSAILNLILDPILIFNFKMGIAGAAIATILAKAILTMPVIYILIKKSGIIKINFKELRIKKSIVSNIFKVAIPASLGQSGAAMGFIVLNSFVAGYGTSTLAAFGMVNRITALIMQPAMGIGAALTAISGINLGNSNIARVREAFKKSMVVTIMFSLVGLSALLIWDNEVIRFFIQSRDDMSVISQGIIFLRFISFSLPLMGIFGVFQGLFQGSGHTKYSMYMEIGRLWIIRIPMILFFKYFTDFGSVGIWFSMSFSNLLICICGYLIYKRNKWQLKILN